MKVECHGQVLCWQPSSTGSEDMYEAHCPACKKYVVLEARSDPNFAPDDVPLLHVERTATEDQAGESAEFTMYLSPRARPTFVVVRIS